MKVSREEAQQSLEAIQQVSAQMRRTVASGADYLILWGSIWFVGFLGNHFSPGATSGLLWLVLTLMGGFGSYMLGRRTGRRVRTRSGLRLALFWLALTSYSLLWIWIARPSDQNQLSLLIVTFAMFGYVVMGLWIGRTVAWIGLGVTALALVGYLLTPTIFNLWMAVLGGGTLMCSGIFVRRAWG